MRMQTRSRTPYASRSHLCASASVSHRSSRPWPASGTALTLRRLPGARESNMDRAPGLSVRLKLTLSYAGFVMLAGALLLGAVWVFLLRLRAQGRDRPRPRLARLYVPRSGRASSRLRASGSHRAGVSVGVRAPWGGGSWPAGCSAPSLESPTPCAWPQGDRFRIGFDFRAVTTSSASWRMPSTPCWRSSKRMWRNSRDLQPMRPTNCAPRWRSRRHFWRSLEAIRVAATTNWSNVSSS